MIVPNFKPTSKQRLRQLERDIGGKKYVIWRAYVLERDGHTCQAGGCVNKEDLQVHHIHKFARYAHLRHNNFNGITLCKRCHQKTFGKEALFATNFTKRAILNEELYQMRLNEGKDI